MRAAVVDMATNIVANIIIADASSDLPPDGCVLIDVDHMPCGIGWVFDPVLIDFRDPSPVNDEGEGG